LYYNIILIQYINDVFNYFYKHLRILSMPKCLLLISIIFLGCLLVLCPLSQELKAQNNKFSIQNLPDDNLNMIRYKAALRLFAGVWAVRDFCTKCSDESTWEKYERRNGTTIGYVMGQFKAGGGLGEEHKMAINAYSFKLAADAYLDSDCDGILEQINSQDWDLYKANRFHEDYVTLRQKK
jgi:hypothetical protein